MLPPIVCGIMLKGLLLRRVFREKVRQIMFVCEASECSAGNCQACIFNSSQFGVFFRSSVEFINIFHILLLPFKQLQKLADLLKKVITHIKKKCFTAMDNCRVPNSII